MLDNQHVRITATEMGYVLIILIILMFHDYLVYLMLGISNLTPMFTLNRSVMRTATVTVMQDGNVQIVPKRTMVQAEASTVV